jgi:protein-L-isoaspartate(D-aspartate) O-methyltransferase
MDSQIELYNFLAKTVGFVSPQIDQAFATIDRGDFVSENFKGLAYENLALPIGYHATISQPTVILFMLNCLDPKLGHKVLDLGSGSGWTTALLAKIVGNSGKVFAVELMPELVEQSQKNLSKYRFKNLKVLQAEKGLGLRKQGPFDRILVSAAAASLPSELVDQLKIGGRMVDPIKNSIWQIDRVSESKNIMTEFEGFSFVPLR